MDVQLSAGDGVDGIDSSVPTARLENIARRAHPDRFLEKGLGLREQSG